LTRDIDAAKARESQRRALKQKKISPSMAFFDGRFRPID
jgi:hypothetical protein